MPPLDADAAANSFWAVFIANCFSFRDMIGSKRAHAAASRDPKARITRARGILTFCFQGLGLSPELVEKYRERMGKET